jgi:lysophospholipase
VWLDDLKQMLEWAAVDGPVHVLAHSMGGHLLLRHLAAGGAHVARAVVLAPMVGLASASLFARLLTALQMLRGRGSDYVIGGGPWRQGMAGDRRQREGAGGLVGGPHGWGGAAGAAGDHGGAEDPRIGKSRRSRPGQRLS